MVETAYGSDLAILVTEPTVFGLHDLSLAVEVCRVLNIPVAVVINRSGSGNDSDIKKYCKRENLSILLELPYDKAIAEDYARGLSIIKSLEYRQAFENLYQDIVSLPAMRPAEEKVQ